MVSGQGMSPDLEKEKNMAKRTTRKGTQIESLKYLQYRIAKQLRAAEQQSDAVGLFSPGCVDNLNFDIMSLSEDDAVRLNLAFAAISQGLDTLSQD